jgi:serine/threonine-protein kinase
VTAPHRWQHVSQLCHAALARDAPDRATFLAEACADDEALRKEVESLLAHDGPASFLNAPTLDVGRRG